MAKVILQGGYASGDMFGIAAMLILDPEMRVLLKEPEPGTTKPNHAASIKAFYELSGIASERIAIVAHDGDAQAAMRGLLGLDVGASIPRKQRLGVNEGTKFIAQKGSDWVTGGHAKTVRNAWRLGDKVSDPKDFDILIKTWLGEIGAKPKKDSKIVILWSRYSGKKGDIHIEHDTGKTGMRQLVERALKSNDYVFIAGDKPHFAHQKGRWSTLASGYAGKVFDITEFWSNKTDALNAWCADRLDQLKLYDFLARRGTSLKHLGFRSGNLEALALIGHTVRYMEEPESEGSKRMEAWHGSELGYERLKIENQVPTRSGQYVKQQIALHHGDGDWDDKRLGVIQPDWAPKKREALLEVKPFNKGDFAPGFSPEDLDRIEVFLSE